MRGEEKEAAQTTHTSAGECQRTLRSLRAVVRLCVVPRPSLLLLSLASLLLLSPRLSTLGVRMCVGASLRMDWRARSPRRRALRAVRCVCGARNSGRTTGTHSGHARRREAHSGRANTKRHTARVHRGRRPRRVKNNLRLTSVSGEVTEGSTQDDSAHANIYRRCECRAGQHCHDSTLGCSSQSQARREITASEPCEWMWLNK